MISLTIPIACLLGGGAVPSLIGLMGDMISFSAGIVVVGAAISGGALLAVPLQLRLPEPVNPAGRAID